MSTPTPDYEALIAHERSLVAHHKWLMEHHTGHLNAVLHLKRMADETEHASGGPVAPSPGISMGTGISVGPPGLYTTYNPVGNVQKHPDIRVDPPYDR